MLKWGIAEIAVVARAYSRNSLKCDIENEFSVCPNTLVHIN